MAKKKNQSTHNEKQSTVMVVLKIDMHCEGCAEKVVKSVHSLDGVESVKREKNDWKKITIVGKVDPVELCENVERKIKKKVELMSPVTKKQNVGAGGLKKQLKQQTTAETQKKFPVSTTVLKVSLDCQGCIDKIQKLVKNTDGFMEMSIDMSNDLVTLKGGMDMNMLKSELQDKLKRKVEVISTKIGDGKKGKGGGGDKDADETGGGEPMVAGYNAEYLAGQSQYFYPQYVYVSGYTTFSYMHATQMFNDENPNACVIM